MVRAAGASVHELIALLGGAANFWLGLSVAGLLHLAWFLLYELPRVRVCTSLCGSRMWAFCTADLQRLEAKEAGRPG